MKPWTALLIALVAGVSALADVSAAQSYGRSGGHVGSAHGEAPRGYAPPRGYGGQGAYGGGRYAPPAGRYPGPYGYASPQGGYPAYPPYPPPAGYPGPVVRRPNSLGADWRLQQEEARAGVRRGQYAPLGRVIEGIARRTPGRQLDAGIEYDGGRAIYRVRWIDLRGRRIDFLVDAATGAILGER